MSSLRSVRLVWWLILAGSLDLCACSAENGTGSLMGSLDVPACEYKREGDRWIERSITDVSTNFLTAKSNWNFFVGLPFDAAVPKFPANHPQNQISVRMQNRSGGWESADALFFWVLDSYEVGRCMRHQMASDGSPDWDEASCDWSTGEGRILIGTQGELVTSHFVLQDTCPSAGLVAEALGACDKDTVGNTCPDTPICPGRGSWISFSKFGPYSDPAKALSPDFKVNIGDQIAASAFHVELCDQITVEAFEANILPIPAPPAIRGTLDGSFSFELEPSLR